MALLRNIFNDLFKEVDFNKKLQRNLESFKMDFYTKNEEHAAFFSGVFLGANKVNFTSRDKDSLFDILGVSFPDVESHTQDCKDVDNTRTIESDPVNLTLLYVAYRFFKLKNKKAATIVLEIYFSRVCAIFIAQWFEFTVSESVAKESYENLSNKFILKRVGSWNAAIQYRADAFINAKYHKKMLTSYNHEQSPGGVKYAATDNRNRIASMFKHIYKNIDEVASSDERQTVVLSSVLEFDSNTEVRDIINNQQQRVTTVFDSIRGKGDFVHVDLIDLIDDKILSLVKVNMVRVISSIDATKKNDDLKLLQRIITNSLAYSDNYLLTNALVHSTVNEQVTALRGLYVSSSQATLGLEIQADVVKLIKKLRIKLPSRQVSVIAGAVQLYIFIVALKLSK